MTKLALHWQIAIGMAIGASLGISLNIFGGTRTTVVQAEQLPSTLTALTIQDSPNHITVNWTTGSGE